MSQSHDPVLPNLVASLEEQGVTSRADQAAALGMAYSTFMRRINQAGLTRRPTLDAWIPWTVARVHHNDPIGRKLRFLAQAAQRRDTKLPGKRGQAVRWARDLVARDQDVTYTKEQGFSIIQADPDDWYLRSLLVAAEHFITDLPQLDTAFDQEERPN